MINFNCPTCGEAMSVPVSQAGAIENCPRCRRACLVPPAVGVAPAIPYYRLRLFGRVAAWLAHRPPGQWVVFGVCVIAWFATAYRPPSLLVPLSYGFVGLAGWIFAARLTAWVCTWRIPAIAALSRRARIRKLLAIALAVIAVIYVGKTDQYFERWTRSDGVMVIDTHRRLGATPVERFLDAEGWSCWGPLSKSGKRHGRWTFSGSGGFEDWWYWYGERVTEGEFRRYEKGG